MASIENEQLAFEVKHTPSDALNYQQKLLKSQAAKYERLADDDESEEKKKKCMWWAQACVAFTFLSFVIWMMIRCIYRAKGDDGDETPPKMGAGEVEIIRRRKVKLTGDQKVELAKYVASVGFETIKEADKGCCRCCPHPKETDCYVDPATQEHHCVLPDGVLYYLQMTKEGEVCKPDFKITAAEHCEKAAKMEGMSYVGELEMGEQPPNCIVGGNMVWYNKAGAVPKSTFAALCLQPKFIVPETSQDEFKLFAGASCGEGYEPITQSWERCEMVAKSMGYTGDSVAHVEYNHPWGASRPQGCFRSDGNNRFHFNRGEGGGFEGNDRILCQNDPNAVVGPAPAIRVTDVGATASDLKFCTQTKKMDCKQNCDSGWIEKSRDNNMCCICEYKTQCRRRTWSSVLERMNIEDLSSLLLVEGAKDVQN